MADGFLKYNPEWGRRHTVRVVRRARGRGESRIHPDVSQWPQQHHRTEICHWSWAPSTPTIDIHQKIFYPIVFHLFFFPTPKKYNYLINGSNENTINNTNKIKTVARHEESITNRTALRVSQQGLMGSAVHGTCSREAWRVCDQHWQQNVSQSYYCSAHFPFYVNELESSQWNTGMQKYSTQTQHSAVWDECFVCTLHCCVIVCHSRRETVETKKKKRKNQLGFKMQSSKASWSFHTALHIHNNTITCALFQKTVTNSDRFQNKNNPTTKLFYHNNKSKSTCTHTDCETKALHVYKVLDCFWFDINQLVYISDAKACAEYMLQSIFNREVWQWMCFSPLVKKIKLKIKIKKKKQIRHKKRKLAQ